MSKKMPDPVEDVPRHIAVIMDGNNRWAKKRFLPGIAGHRAGVKALRRVLKACAERKVEVLTLFAFSSENWQRPENEVKGLMGLFLQMLKREASELKKNRVRLKIIGDISAFSDEIKREIEHAEALTGEDYDWTLQIAANYGGQWDIVQATKQLAAKVAQGQLELEQIDAELLESHLSTGGMPLPDLCIRTGGDCRISNFLLWQFAYAELYFTPVLWPDFGGAELNEAIAEFSSRQRRFGKTSEQVETQ